MFKLKNISLTLNNKEILKNINLSVQPNDRVVIVGHNGTGKSSLLNIITGNAQASHGTLELDGKDITDLSNQKRMQWLSFLTQKPLANGASNMSIQENFALYKLKNIRARLGKTLDYVSQEFQNRIKTIFPHAQADILTQKFGSISGGQQQMIAFVLATLHTPKLLLLDEPTAALDPQAATILLNQVNRYVHEHTCTFIMITHDPMIAITMATKILVMKEGRIIKVIINDGSQDIKPEHLIGSIDYQAITKS